MSSCSTGATCKNLCYSTSSEDIQSRLEAAYTNAISARELEQLFKKGYAVIENAGFDPSVGREIRKEIEAIPNNRFTANSTRFVKDGTQTEHVKQNIRAFCSVSRDRRNILPCRGIGLVDAIERNLPSETPSEMLFNASLKLQINDGENARFPIHFDSDSSTDQRRWTCLVYLNAMVGRKRKAWRGVGLISTVSRGKEGQCNQRWVPLSFRYVAH